MKRLLTIGAGLCGLFAFLSGAWAWQTDINGSDSAFDSARAAALDGAGNLVAAGVTSNSGTGTDFTVIKFHAISGLELWRRVINGTANGADEANAVTVDANGDVIAAGYTSNNGTGNDFTVVKFHGATGAELWRQVIDGGSSVGSDFATTITVDAAGDVVAGGVLGSFFAAAGFVVSDSFVVKLNGASGAELWRQVSPSSTAGNAANSVRVDATGNVLVAGVIERSKFGEGKFIVTKFDGTNGAELWRQLIEGSDSFNNDEAYAVTVDPAGNVFAAGSTANTGTFSDFTVVKFDGATGAVLWRQEINGTANSSDVALALTVDSSGHVLASGVIQNAGTDGDFAVVKFDGASGAVLWRQEINGTADIYDEAVAVAADAAGDVVAAGFTNNAGASRDFAVVKFDGATGAELWRHLVNGASNQDDQAFAVVIDPAGNVLAAGSTGNSGTGLGDFTVVKLSGSDGDDFVSPATLAVRPREIRAGGKVTAKWSGIAAPTSTDWIGLYLPGAANTAHIARIYVTCSHKPRGPKPSGSCDFTVPGSLAPGTYQLRLLANNGYTTLATSNTFVVNRGGRNDARCKSDKHTPSRHSDRDAERDCRNHFHRNSG